mgnify:CR=1 FL=1
METENQERELLDLQERILNNNEAVPTVTLDEPSITICIAVFVLMILVIKSKKTRNHLKG